MTYIDELKKHRDLLIEGVDIPVSEAPKKILPKKKSLKKINLDVFWNISGRYPEEYSSDKPVDYKQVVTRRPVIDIVFDYPLSRKVTLRFTHNGGWTLKDICNAVSRGYHKIYREEEKSIDRHHRNLEKDPDLDPIEAELEAADSGKYGIWGHSIEDLGLSGIREIKPGVFHIFVDS